MTLCVLDLVWLTSVVVTLTRGWRPLLYSRPEKNMSLDASEKCSRTNVLLFTTASADTLICSRKGSCGFLPSRRRQRRRNATVHRVFRDDHVKSNKLASHACVRTILRSVKPVFCLGPLGWRCMCACLSLKKKGRTKQEREMWRFLTVASFWEKKQTTESGRGERARS